MTALAYAEAPAIPAPRRADRADVPVVDRRHLHALAAGDDATWQTTVRRYEGLLRSAARVVLRSDADVDEAVQRTWVLLLPQRRAHQRPAVPAGLAVHDRPARGAGHPAGAAARGARARTSPTSVAPHDPDMAAALMRRRSSARPWTGPCETLPETQRRIVQALLREPESYDALSQELGIPRGSLGPLRGRAVKALRAQLEPSLR